jgi:hypothetical protein
VELLSILSNHRRTHRGDDGAIPAVLRYGMRRLLPSSNSVRSSGGGL